MDAVKAANVGKMFWSGLMDVFKVSGGKYTKVEYFDSKVRRQNWRFCEISIRADFWAMRQ